MNTLHQLRTIVSINGILGKIYFFINYSILFSLTPLRERKMSTDSSKPKPNIPKVQRDSYKRSGKWPPPNGITVLPKIKTTDNNPPTKRTPRTEK